jgi:TolB protein
MYNCPEARKWALAAWQGADGVAADEALATCGEGAVEAAYALDASSGEWLRWFGDRPEISNLAMVENMQGLIVLGSSSASPPPTVKLEPPEQGRMRGCPLPGRWGIAVWEGPDGSEAGEALETCGVWQADVAYSLDPGTGVWLRWFGDRPELATLDRLASLTAVVLWGRSKLEPGGHIAFVSDRGGYDDEIYVMYANGASPTLMTYNTERDMDPAWSPDGTKIAYDTLYEIYVMNVNGTGRTKLHSSATAHTPAWSPDGTKIAFADAYMDYGLQEWSIHVMSADGTSVTNLRAGDYDPAWSPDGTKIAYTGVYCLPLAACDTEVYVMNADGTGRTMLSYDGSQPAWSPDGTKIAFVSDRDDNDEIYVMNADGTDQTNLTNHEADDRHPTWSPYGSKIAFDSDREGNRDIWVMNADGTGLTRLTSNPADDRQPDWSPW